MGADVLLAPHFSQPWWARVIHAPSLSPESPGWQQALGGRWTGTQKTRVSVLVPCAGCVLSYCTTPILSADTHEVGTVTPCLAFLTRMLWSSNEIKWSWR